MYKWNYNEEVTAEEFIERLIPLVCDPVSMMWDCEGDMLMSDFHKLCQASRQLQDNKKDQKLMSKTVDNKYDPTQHRIKKRTSIGAGTLSRPNNKHK